LIDITHLKCGAVLLGESRFETGDSGVEDSTTKNRGIQTVSVCIYLPCGVVFDDLETLGSSLLITELFNRGTTQFKETNSECIELDGREFRARFERKGTHFSAGGGFERCVIRVDCVAQHLAEALKLIGAVIAAPRFSDPLALEESRRMLINDIRSRSDDPAGLAAQHLTELFFAPPFNRAREGTEAGILAANSDVLRAGHFNALSGGSIIFSWCGATTQAQMVTLIEQEFYFLHPAIRTVPKCFARNTQDLNPLHIAKPTEQRSVMMAFESASMLDAGYFPAKIASLCLGGGLFSRLFNEVREKRGLVYDVSCSHASNRDRGWFVVGFACAPQQFEEASACTRSVILDFSPSEIELQRARAQVKLSLAVADESRGSRCETLAAEWCYRGRVRSEEELLSAVNNVTAESIAELWRVYSPFRNCVEVSVGGES